MVNIILFAMTFVLWFTSWLLVSSDAEMFAPRLTWSMYEPTLLHEACFSVANLMAAGKLVYFFQYVEAFGPLQVGNERDDRRHYVERNIAILTQYRNLNAISQS